MLQCHKLAVCRNISIGFQSVAQRDCQPRFYNQQQRLSWFFHQLLTSAALLDCNNTLRIRDAFQCIAQPTTALQDCILSLPLHPGILPGSANQCILGDMYLRSNLPRKVLHSPLALSSHTMYMTNETVCCALSISLLVKSLNLR